MKTIVWTIEPLIQRGRPGVVLRTGDRQLPWAGTNLHLPGIEYVRVFDLVRAALLGWSPNVRRVIDRPDAIGGSPSDCAIEDTMDALTYSLTLHHGLLTAGPVLDPDMEDALIRSAAQASDAPTSPELWARCLERSIKVYQEVAENGIRQLRMDLDGRVIDVLA
jgi:hypothetical protein